MTIFFHPVDGFLKSERHFWIRIIKKYTDHFEGHEKTWKEVTNKTPIHILQELAIATEEFFTFHPFLNLAPLHIAVERGSMQLCQYIIAKTEDKNPKGTMVLSSQIYVHDCSYKISNKILEPWLEKLVSDGLGVDKKNDTTSFSCNEWKYRSMSTYIR